MTNLRSLSDLFKAARKLAAVCAFAIAMAVAASAQTNTFPASGNAGVGTTSPGNKLEVKAGSGGSDATVDGLAVSSTNTTYTTKGRLGSNYDRTYFTQNAYYNGSAWGADNGSRTTASVILHAGDGDSNISFMTSAANNNGIGTERMRIDKNGSVGIGTTNPSIRLGLKLDVASSANYGGAVLSTWSSGSHGSLLDLIRSRSDTPGTHAAVANNDLLGIVSGRGTDGANFFTAAQMQMWVDGAVSTNIVPGRIVFNVINSSGSAIDAVTIKSSGNVGIGTTNPGRPLVVAADASGIPLRVYRNVNNVGYGTGINWAFNNNAGNVTDYAYVNSSIVSNSAGSENGTLGFFTVKAGTMTQQAIIDQNGNVGIGTTPGALYRLDVQGRINSSELCIATDCRSSWSQVGGGGGSTSFSNITAGTNTLTLLVGSGGSLGASGSGTINATTLGGATFAAPGAIGATTPGTGAFSAVGINTAPSSYKLDVNGNTNVTGNLNVTGTVNAKYQDLAEWVPSSEQLSAGTVVVLDTTKSNQVISSGTAYDTRVAGVISAQPGITLGESGEGKVLVATTGRVRVKVDASRGPIQIGDLLVTSDVTGVAMKSEAVNLGGVQIHRPGTIIGKALEPLAKGSGEILVLLSLQ